MKANTLAICAAALVNDNSNLHLLAAMSKTPQGLEVAGLIPDPSATRMYLFDDGSSLIRREDQAGSSTATLDATGTALLLKGITANLESVTGKGLFGRLLQGAMHTGFSPDRAKKLIAAAARIPAISQALDLVKLSKPARLAA